MKKTISGIVVLVFFVCSAYASDVRVRVFSKYEIQNAVVTCLYCQDRDFYQCGLSVKDGKIEADYGKGGKKLGLRLELFKGMGGQYAIKAAGQSRIIPGHIEASLLPAEKGIVLIATMDIEEYVPCVLASELDMTLYKPELAKAHAIVIRTFARNNNKRHDDYDFCDLTHCEVFKGVPTTGSEGGRRKAEGNNDKNKKGNIWYDPVIATKGMVLSGACAKEAVYFSGCCGGITENAGEFTSGKEGKCGKSIKDVLNGKNLCEAHRYYKWIKHITKGDVERALAVFVDEKRPQVMDIMVSSRTATGRVKQLDFTYISGGVERHVLLDVNKYLSVFGKEAGWALVPSKWFDIKKEEGGFVLNGRGHGHGVGLCLQGASTLAGMGKTYREILKFYFPELEIRSER